MAYNPPPPDFIGNNNRSNMSPMHHSHNNYGSSSSFSQHADNGNRENVGWNDDNRGVLQHGYSRPPDYNTMNMNDSKYNHNHFSQNNYHDRHTSSHHNNNNNNNPNNNNNNVVKRAAKRRVKHDLPGPAGDYFRQKKQQKSAAAAAANRKTALSSKISSSSSSSSQNEKKQQEMQLVVNAEKNDKVAQNNNDLVDSKLIKINRSDDDGNVDDNNSSNSSNFIQQQLQQLQQRDEQLFHDHSSDLHECNAWNLMCTTLNRIVPPANLLLHNHHHHHNHYKSKVRSSIPSSKYALIHEIHDGEYDKCHLEKHLYLSDLCIPKILVGYVASVQCHAHSDWTALLVDEMHGVHKYYYNGGVGGSGGNSSSSRRSRNAGRGIVCWIEERLVKQHSNWIRPGAVWMIEGAKLALFSSLEDDDDDDEEEEEQYDVNNPTASIAAASEVVDISPSTENSRGGGSIDRMILVGESSMVYAWTPEEASSTFTHEEFSSLMERRCNLGLHNDDDDGEELLQLHDQKENDAAGNAATSCDVDGTSPSDAKKNVVSNDGQVDEILIKGSPSNDSNTAKLSSSGSKGSGDNAETVQIIDVTNEHGLNEKQKVEGQALEACSLINEVRDEANDISESVVDMESQDATTELSAKVNTPNSYTKKNDEVKVVSSCLEKSSAGKEMTEPTDRDGVDSSILVVQSEDINLSDTKRTAAKSPKGQRTTLDDAPQIADETAQPQHVEIDDSFDDMLDDDSLDEGMPFRSEGASTNTLNANTGAVEGNSFDDMLDEDETPRKIEKESAGDNTPGGESFDMMLDNDSDDNVVALFQARDESSSNNLFSPSQGLSVLDKDDLLDLGDEDDDDF